jgi:hopene-associated glycosyltransferase HpnB
MVLGVTVVAIWLFLLLGRGFFWRMRVEPPLQPKTPAPLPPRIVAIVPARNEADVVGRAVASLANQNYAGEFHIVLVDDHSDDGTAAIARAAAPPEILTVIDAAPLAAGWTGKLSAVATGIRYAARFEADYFLLTDADIAHPPANLADLSARAESGYDLVSYMAKLRCDSIAERALIPAFVFFFFLLYPPAWGTGAAGGCMLVRRSMLERAGGVERIHGALIDDCSLAASVRQAGGRVWLGLSRETRSIRPYGGFAEIGRMISRSAFTQLRYSVWLLIATVLGLLLTYLAPPVLTLTGSALGSAAWLLMTIAYIPALRFYGVPILYAPWLPAIATFYMGATIHSAVAHWRGRGGAWKGRTTPMTRTNSRS